MNDQDKTDLHGIEPKQASIFKNRLRTLIFMCFVMLLIGVIGTVSYVLQGIARPLLVRENNRLIEQLANKLVSDLQQKIVMTEALARTVASLGKALDHNAQTFKRIIPEVINLPGSESVIAGGGIWPEPYMFDAHAERRSFFWGRQKDGTLAFFDDYNNPEGKGYHNEEWYVPARYLKKGDCFWSKSYMDPYSYQPMVTCTVPIRDNNGLIGVSTIDLKLEGLHELFKESSRIIGGYIFAVDRNNKFLSFPDEESTKIKLPEKGGKLRQEFIYAGDLAKKSPLFIPVSNALDKINAAIIQEAQRAPTYEKDLYKKITYESYQINQEEAKLIAAVLVDPFHSKKTTSNLIEGFYLEDDLILKEPVIVSIFHMPEAYWKIVFVTPYKEAVAIAASITCKVLIYLIATLCLLLLIAFLLLRQKLLVPLKDITSRLKQIGQGDSNLDLRLDIAANDELGELAYYFNRRTIELKKAHDSLQKTHNELEQRVEERTKDLKEAKEAADKANQAKSIFLANMSHELRTPLNAILGFSQLMACSDNINEEQRENMRIISRSGEHLLRLINDVLAMSKIEAGRTLLNEQRVNLYQLLDDLHTMFRLKADEKDLKLIFNRSAEVPQYVYTDEIKLRQVLINLINNALKFTQQGFVSLSLRGEKLQVENGPSEWIIHFEVEDTGPGISPEEMGLIFEAFVQPRSDQNAQEGTGLGLPISRGFVQLMGGEMTVKSAKGKGSVFSFYIRIRPEDGTDVQTIHPAQKAVALEHGQPHYRVLVADDNLINRQLLIRMLSPLGFELREAHDGQQAVEQWKEFSPHLILMDIRMPVIDGLEATKRIKAMDKGRQTVIIAITASVFEEQKKDIMSAGCDDFLRKPFMKEDLLSMMERHMAVRFVFEDPNKGHMPPESDPDALDPARLAKLPLDLLNGLEQAAQRAEMDRITSLICDIRDHDAISADALARLANDFAYDKIIELTKMAGESK